MQDDQGFVALVPMRHHSERVPGKNYRPMAERPLYEYILESLQRCEQVHRIVVDTDSPIIVKGISRNFPEVLLLDRPEALRGGEVPMNDILRHDVSVVPASFYLQTHSTNPLLRAETISRAIHTFLEGFPQHDSLFSVTRLQTRLWDKHVKPINHDPSVLLRTQDLDPLYEENSCIYIFERTSFLERGNRLGEKPIMFEVDIEEALDIDEEVDFQLADCMMRWRLSLERGMAE
jgi:CMP-N-acetylneuraminic acid synthetase